MMAACPLSPQGRGGCRGGAARLALLLRESEEQAGDVLGIGCSFLGLAEGQVERELEVSLAGRVGGCSGQAGFGLLFHR